jgi:hypothetical protein
VVRPVNTRVGMPTTECPKWVTNDRFTVSAPCPIFPQADIPMRSY